MQISLFSLLLFTRVHMRSESGRWGVMVLSLAYLVFLGNPRLRAAEDLPPDAAQASNCVDACIIVYCHCRFDAVGIERLRRVISEQSLPREPPYRSLYDCQRILGGLGHAVIAERRRLNRQTDFPPLSIVHVHGDRPQDAGHVVVVRRLDDGRHFVFDPARGREWTLIEPNRIRGDMESIFLSSPSVARGLLPAVLLVLLVFCSTVAVGHALRFALVKRKTVGRRATCGTVAFYLVVMCSPLAGCNSRDGVYVESSTHFDFGILEEAQIENLAEHRFVVTNASDEAVALNVSGASCSCVVGPQMLSGYVLQPSTDVEVPVSIRLEHKFGSFEESIQLHVEGRLEPIDLVLRGFVMRAPRVYPQNLLLLAREGGSTTKLLEVHTVGLGGASEQNAVRLNVNVLGKDAGLFSVGEQFCERIDTLHAAITKVFIPITYMQSPARPAATALIDIGGFESGEHLRVPLTGGLQRGLTLPKEVFLPPLQLGRTFVEDLPVTVHDAEKLVACNCFVASDEYAASFVAGPDVIRLNGCPVRLGKFETVLLVEVGGETVSCILRGEVR